MHYNARFNFLFQILAINIMKNEHEIFLLQSGDHFVANVTIYLKFSM